MRKIHLIVGLLSISTVLSASNKEAYIERYAPMAIQLMQKSGIPASIILAQGFLESGAGSGELAIASNNHFGIKCKSHWNGLTYYKKDDDRNAQGELIKSCFRAYDSPEASYRDYIQFLSNNPRYESLFSYSNTDYKSWARGLLKCGYATARDYAEKLIGVIERYQLQRFDITTDSTPVQYKLLYANEQTNDPNNDFEEWTAAYAPPAVSIENHTPPVKELVIEFESYAQANVPPTSVPTKIPIKAVPYYDISAYETTTINRQEYTTSKGSKSVSPSRQPRIRK